MHHQYILLCLQAACSCSHRWSRGGLCIPPPTSASPSLASHSARLGRALDGEAASSQPDQPKGGCGNNKNHSQAARVPAEALERRSCPCIPKEKPVLQGAAKGAHPLRRPPWERARARRVKMIELRRRRGEAPGERSLPILSSGEGGWDRAEAPRCSLALPARKTQRPARAACRAEAAAPGKPLREVSCQEGPAGFSKPGGGERGAGRGALDSQPGS
ncbi:Hypothetical predicted protein [Podarcis lilfordi]|uniref:Uncharacterized protein n=1 Tax=Podarcis lilfordi TaxID=74358 RepID=A0AA35JZK1_9SAUR|nr:Hypothetical predicted protein [Podarcis lilfordi]